MRRGGHLGPSPFIVRGSVCTLFARHFNDLILQLPGATPTLRRCGAFTAHISPDDTIEIGDVTAPIIALMKAGVALE